MHAGPKSDSVTSKRSHMKTKRARDEEDQANFMARPPAEKDDFLVGTVERVRISNSSTVIYVVYFG